MVIMSCAIIAMAFLTFHYTNDLVYLFARAQFFQKFYLSYIIFISLLNYIECLLLPCSIKISKDPAFIISIAVAWFNSTSLLLCWLGLVGITEGFSPISRYDLISFSFFPHYIFCALISFALIVWNSQPPNSIKKSL